MANLIGQTLLNQFRVDTFVASGGMGAVYQVTDLRRNATLAMKILHADLADDPTVFKRFQREAQALRQLKHPNIVPFYGLYQDRGATFLLEAFISGSSLQEILRENHKLPVNEALAYMKGLCAALGYAHSLNIVHCDVKPGNVMVDHKGGIYLTDFGIARFVGATTTTTMGVAGTPAYMAPEQIVGRGIGPATDIYALGVMLYEMLTGQKPFRGTEPETEAGGATPSERIRYGHLRVPPPDPRQVNPAINPKMSQVMLKALAKNPAERFRSTQDFFAALCWAVQTRLEDVSGEATILGQVSVPPSPPHPPSSSTPRPDPRSRRRNIALVFVAGALVLFVLLWMASQSDVVNLISETPTISEMPIITPVSTTTESWTFTPELTLTPSETVAIIPTESPTMLSPSATAISFFDQAPQVYIPAGEFSMGSNRNYEEKPVHIVYLDAYWIDQYEVTNAMFTAFVKATGYRTDAESAKRSKVWARTNGKTVEETTWVDGASWRHPTGANNITGLENHPVVQVSWNDAAAYCEWVGRRLPTEAEWEKAARGTDERWFPWGKEFNCAFGNYDDETNIDRYVVGCDGFPRTAPVDSFPAGKSPYGVYNMSGNVWEWVADWYSETYYSESPYANPPGPIRGAYRVARGGSWFSEMKFLYISYRDGEENDPSYRDDILGFRCAQDATP
jgi:serine/threonine-protein kinase